MTKLLIIADDLTGALDTGVQFAAKNIPVGISIYDGRGRIGFREEVCVLDTQSRHLPPEKAAEVVRAAAGEAVSAGVPYIYKKTDSALRGNIGAELSALTDVCREKLCFVPAYPKNGRVTVKGIQYVNGVPLAESVFGNDPLEPADSSYIPDIISKQSSIKCRIITAEEQKQAAEKQTGFSSAGPDPQTPAAEPAIQAADTDIYDASSDADLERISTAVRGRYRLFAGCAGFAEFMDRIISFSKAGAETFSRGKKLVIISGSLNRITKDQIKRAGKRIEYRCVLNDRQLFDPGYSNSDEAESFVRQAAACRTAALMTKEKQKNGTEGPYEKQVPPELRHERVRDNLGKLAAKILSETDRDTVLCVFGGDTLYALVRELKTAVRPVREIGPGVVLARLRTGSGSRYVVTKSGGLGSEEAVSGIMDAVLA